jgi:hypothetical protein
MSFCQVSVQLAATWPIRVRSVDHGVVPMVLEHRSLDSAARKLTSVNGDLRLVLQLVLALRVRSSKHVRRLSGPQSWTRDDGSH